MACQCEIVDAEVVAVAFANSEIKAHGTCEFYKDANKVLQDKSITVGPEAQELWQNVN